MNSFITQCIDFFFPPHEDVVKARAVSSEKLHALYSLHFDKARRVYTALPYAEEAVRALIRANKYYADPDAARLLAEALQEMVGAILEERMLEGLWRHPLLVPMPASPKRLRERGHNQVTRIVACLAHTENWERRDVLKRRHRESQTRVIKSKRAENIAGAFYVPKTFVPTVKGRAVLLVDDVCESGSTMKDARRALAVAGAREVVGIALAR